MKFLLPFLSAIALLHFNIFAQCPPSNITTNPDKTTWENPPYDALYKKNTGTNFFDWRLQHFSVSMPSFPYSQVTSPYYYGSSATALKGLAKGENNPENYDFYPEDGWELIRKNFGLKADGSQISNETSIGPHYILYNKYTGTLRVIGWTNTAVGYFPTINVKIKFKDQSKATGLFAFYNTTAKPLDVPATGHATTPAELTSDPLVPFFADFKLAYDPCTCVFDSNLEIEFNKVQKMNIDLYGRLFATSVPVDLFDPLISSSNVLFNKNFLPSVFDNSNEGTLEYRKVTAGMLTYRTLDAMITDAKSSAEASYDKQAFKKGIDIAQAFLSAKTGKEALTKSGKKMLSLFSDFFQGAPGISGSLFSVIAGEMALNGTIENYLDQRISIPLANPGSLNSSMAQECCGTGVNYPMYNETLGVFALLRTPEVSLNTTTENWTTGNGIITVQNTTFQLANPLQYMFNPALKVNLAKSKISASFEAEGNVAVANLNFFEGYTSYNSFRQTWVTKFYSPLVPIESLLFAKMQFKGINMNSNSLKLSLVLDLEFQELNKNGVPNKSLTVLTFPIKIINSSSTPSNHINGYPENLNVTETTYDNDGVAAWEDVTISGTQIISASRTNPVTISGGGEVVLTPGTTLYRRLVVKAGTYPPKAFTSWIYPQPVNELLTPKTSFDCNSTTYLAKSVSARVNTNEETLSVVDKFSSEIEEFMSIYPNPTSSDLTVKFNLAQSGNVRISIVNFSGAVVFEPLNGFMESGVHEIVINTSEIQQGINVLKLQSASGTKFEKIMILK
ncbi:MAG: T9SS type A sorting domain-containing protein [Flammeovirgaceae bacterium]|jgi:hypothetical protein|nr:T9SS type A sorting domain-containing protein [Flammeovirgaceae bacterium]